MAGVVGPDIIAGSKPTDIETVFRTEAGRVLATLIRLIGDFTLAEDSMQDAFAAAVDQWRIDGLPANPRAWLVRVARNKAVDRQRRQALIHAKNSEVELALSDAEELADDDLAVRDDVLRLIFTCCHPALSLEAQIALTLRTVCSLSTASVAHGFLVSEDAMGQRIVRAKRKIRDAGIPYETPPASKLAERIDGVLGTVYLVFTAGYRAAPTGETEGVSLSLEAIRLAAMLDRLLPGNDAIKGLLSLMLLHHGRHAARFDATGAIVLLGDQDRTLWDLELIEQGLSLVETALRMPGPPSPYAVQAAIAALHAKARRADETDWPQIVALYEVLLRLQPSPVVELNHAAAVAMVDGPQRGLDLMDAVSARGALSDYHLLHGARAELLTRLGRPAEARDAYLDALNMRATDAERRFYLLRLEQLGGQNP